MAVARGFVDLRDRGFVRAAHAAGRGGIAVALAHMVLASDFGLRIELGEGPDAARGLLFGENLGRYLVAVPPEHEDAVRGAAGARRLGIVTDGPPRLAVTCDGAAAIDLDASTLRRAFHGEVSR